MKAKLSAFIAACTIATLPLANTASAEGTKLFYRGDYDDQISEAPNGAKVNAGYNKFLSEGAFGGTQLVEVQKGVWSVVGYSLSNYTFVEGKTGLIAFDSGSNMGMGQTVLKMVQEKINKPVVAIIYSHFHYTGGSKAYQAANPDVEIEVYGHPDLDHSISDQGGTFRTMQNRRGGMQLGAYLPHEGPDAAYGPAEPQFEDPALNIHGHLPVTYAVKDGEEVTIDGVKAIFYHAVADTRDSLIVYFPELDMALHNTAVTPMLFSLYTLRGDYYRNPVEMIESIDKLRSLNAKYVVGAHGLPLVGERAQEVITAHRDAYAFTYNQSVRLINQGKGPDELVATIRLPEHLDQNPDLFPGYVDHEYNVRGQYRGIVGWYGEEIADLHPPTVKELGQTIVAMAGGTDKVIAESKTAFGEKKYNLTAKLLTYVLAVEPDNKTAKQLKADALRQMAYTTRSGIQTRSYLLTNALHLEGKIDMNKPPKFLFFGSETLDTLMAAPVGSSVKALEIKIDPGKSANLESVIQVTFSDADKSWAIHIRRGVAEVTDVIPAKTDATLELPRKVWAQLVTGNTTVENAVTRKDVKVTGNADTLYRVLGSFDNITI